MSERFMHLARLTDDIGLFEHADGDSPRIEHGYCVDDAARGLIATVREPDAGADLRQLSETYLRFVLAAQVPDGRFRNRRDSGGEWRDQPSTQDCWGRALWGLGTAAARSSLLAPAALEAFDRGVRHRSRWSRSMAFASLGAAEILSVLPDHRGAREILGDTARLVGRHGMSRVWIWPEPRLRYANAAVAEAVLAAGSLLDEPGWTRQGLAMLRWLTDMETTNDHLSVTPVGGWALGEPRPGFDQQPIEVAALADASARALALTGDPVWSQTLGQCADWFAGANDIGIEMMDRSTGAGYDGLMRGGRNDNRGAESTLAVISTMQHAARLLVPVA